MQLIFCHMICHIKINYGIIFTSCLILVAGYLFARFYPCTSIILFVYVFGLCMRITLCMWHTHVTYIFHITYVAIYIYVR